MDEIKFWDSNKEHISLSGNERQMRDLAKQDYARFSCLEEIKWKQKAKVKWLKGVTTPIFSTRSLLLGEHKLYSFFSEWELLEVSYCNFLHEAIYIRSWVLEDLSLMKFSLKESP